MRSQITTVEIKAVKPDYTPEEYLELEEKSDCKNEYHNGEIVSMAGGTTNHNTIALNLAAYFKFGLKGKGYNTYIGDVKLWIPRYHEFTYPDVMVIKGKPIYYGTNTTTVMNPLLIAEVLSKSTRDYDQGDKFLYYRSIPELKEYILIDQDKYHVMQHKKISEDEWLLSEYELEDVVLDIQSIGLKISVSDIYDQVI